MITDCVLQLSNVNDFLKMLTIFKSRSFELTKRYLRRETLNFFNFDDVIFINDKEFNSRLRSKILKSK